MNRQRNSIVERCELCGQAVDPGDVDSVQIHAGIVGGFVHADCLAEYDDDVSEPEDGGVTID